METGRERVPTEEFRQLFDHNYNYVWSSLRRLGVDERDLEDLTHDVFLEIHGKLNTYKRELPIRPWLFAFAFRFASDYRKLARHKTPLHDAPDAVSELPTAEDALIAKDSALLLQKALDGLSLELRGVIVLYEIDEVPMKDITDALNIPLQTGYSRLRLARAQCAETVKRLATITKKGAPAR